MQQHIQSLTLTTFPPDGPKNLKYCSEAAQASMSTTRKEGEICPSLKHVTSLKLESDRISVLQSKLRSLDRQDREQSIILLAGYPVAVPLLIEALHDTSPIVRKHAAAALAYYNANSTIHPPESSSNDKAPIDVQICDAELSDKNAPHENKKSKFRLFSRTLTSSDFISIKATLQHLQHCIRSNDYYTTYLSRNQIERQHGVTTHNGRALHFGCQGHLTKEDFDTLFLSWDGVCYWCSERVPIHDTHVDHYIPLSRLGPNIPENLVITCSDCNLKKNAKDPFEFAQLIGKTESEVKLNTILSASKMERSVYEAHRGDRPRYEQITRIAYIENYSAFVFAPTFFDDQMLSLYREVPREKRVFHKFTKFVPLNTFWVVDEAYGQPLIDGIEKLGGKIAFIIPEYSSRKVYKPNIHPGFNEATLRLFRKTLRDQS